jgi:hypothetical protein
VFRSYAVNWCDIGDSHFKFKDAYFSGTVTAGTLTATNLTALSDFKLKENIVDCTSKLSEINSLRVVNYNLKNDTTKQKHLGFIAQELEQVFPKVIVDIDDADGTTVTKATKTNVLIPILVKALQELSAKHETLQTKYDDLLQRVILLENN